MQRNHEGREDFQLGDVQYQRRQREIGRAKITAYRGRGETAKRADTLIVRAAVFAERVWRWSPEGQQWLWLVSKGAKAEGWQRLDKLALLLGGSVVVVIDQVELQMDGNITVR